MKNPSKVNQDSSIHQILSHDFSRCFIKYLHESHFQCYHTFIILCLHRSERQVLEAYINNFQKPHKIFPSIYSPHFTCMLCIYVHYLRVASYLQRKFLMNIAKCRECREEIMNAQHGDCFINSKDLLRVTFKCDIWRRKMWLLTRKNKHFHYLKTIPHFHLEHH